MNKYVISLGGNALGNNPVEQKQLLAKVADALYPLIKNNNSVVIVHGNGPQVGMINLAFNESRSTPEMPFAECGAMSQGYIGFHIQNAFYNKLRTESSNKKITTIVTQVLVDEKDEAFNDPTKPIGSFYTKQEAEQISQKRGYAMKEDAGRGYRRVVASPKPIDIIEKEGINYLLEKGEIVIAAGGGGIPVIYQDNKLIGIDAVIDKDYASAKVAEIIDADTLIILTAVDKVYLNYNQPNEKALDVVTVSELEKLIKEDHFKKGSMLPKIEACMEFTRKTKKPSLIASLDQAERAINNQAGTKIIYD
ncbi:MAG: carbamate kinase [Acholeplasmataceae bacterium]